MFGKLGQCMRWIYSTFCNIIVLFYLFIKQNQSTSDYLMNVVNSNKMNKPFDFITSSFAANLSDTYSISVRQLPDGYIFYITDNNNQGVAIKRITAEHITAQTLKNEPLLQLNYHTVAYIGYGPFALIPKSLIIDENYATFLPIENNLRRRAKSIVNPLTDDIIITAYANQWTMPDTKCRKCHEVELLASVALSASTANSMWAEITTQHINIVVVKDHKLHLANTYPITCDNDAAYYILACYQQLNLSQEDTPLTITGNIAYINPTPFLKDYIRHIEPLKPHTWSQELPNEYTSLFALQTYILEK